MNFNELFNKISPTLRIIARYKNGHGFFIDGDDLYQEMCIHLWNKFKDGVPEGINNAYIIKGCELHIMNYLRKQRQKGITISLEEPINDNGGTIEDLLVDNQINIDRFMNTSITIDEIKRNGLTKKEKQVFSFLLQGYTVREIGQKLNISHVMVIKFKKKIISKWQKRKNIGYQAQ